MGFLLTFLILGLSIFILYNFQKNRKNSIWIKNGIPYKGYQFIEFSFEMLSTPLFEINFNDFKKLGKIYGAGKYCLSINDLDLIKEIFVKEKRTFLNRADFKTGNPILDSMLFIARDDQWKNLRKIMSPTFTNKKMKDMHLKLKKCIETTLDKANKLSLNKTEFDLNKFWGSFTADTIGKCCFGIDISLKNDGLDLKNSKDKCKFLKNMNKMVYVPMPIFILFLNLPSFITNNLMAFRIFPTKTVNYFCELIKSIVKKNIELKKEKKEIDFLHSLFEHNDDYSKMINTTTKIPKLNSNEISAQCLVFMIGGYDTTKTLLSWLCHRIIIHENIQEKVYLEIKNFLDDNCKSDSKKIEIEDLEKFKYLDALINETLRFYPPLTLIERTANNDITVKCKNLKKDLKINKNMEVAVSIYNLHHDPDYFPFPEEFIPERWLSEHYLKNNYENGELKKIDIRHNKLMTKEFIKEIQKFNKEAFIPFGLSHRVCIGKRFALTSAKLVLINILYKYKFIYSKKFTPKCKPSMVFIHSDELICKIVKR